MAQNGILGPLLRRGKDAITICTREASPSMYTETTYNDRFQKVVWSIVQASQGEHRVVLSENDQADVWFIVTKMWDFLEMTKSLSTEKPMWLAAAMQQCSKMLDLVSKELMSLEERSAVLAIRHKVGLALAETGDYSAAEAAYYLAYSEVEPLLEMFEVVNIMKFYETADGIHDVILDRMQNCWRLGSEALSLDMLAKAIDVGQMPVLPWRQRFEMNASVLGHLYTQAQRCLADGRHGLAHELLSRAHTLVTQHMEIDEDEDEETTAKYKESALGLEAKVLHLRAEMHLLDEAPAYTLNCIRILRNMPHALASSPGVSLTALKAAMQADKPAQANLELLGLVSHPEASADDCIEALSAASKAPSCSALKEAAKLVMEQWTKKDPGMAVRVLEVVMPSMAYMEVAPGALVHPGQHAAGHVPGQHHDQDMEGLTERLSSSHMLEAPVEEGTSTCKTPQQTTPQTSSAGASSSTRTTQTSSGGSSGVRTSESSFRAMSPD